MTTTIRGPPITFTSIQAVVWPISIMIELSSKITMFLHFFGEYISSSSMYYTSRGAAKIWNLDKCVNYVFGSSYLMSFIKGIFDTVSNGTTLRKGTTSTIIVIYCGFFFVFLAHFGVANLILFNLLPL